MRCVLDRCTIVGWPAGFPHRRADVERRVVGPDDDDVLVGVGVAAGELRGVVLFTAEHVLTRIRRAVRVAADPEGDDQLLRAKLHVGAVAVDRHDPLLGVLVPPGIAALGAGPVVELHERDVVLEPVTELVLGGEHRPVVGELEVGQVVVPDRVVQVEGLVALAPRVAGAVVLLEDHGRDAVPFEPGAEADATLPAADDDDVGLLGVAERRVGLGLALQPGPAALGDLVLDPLLAPAPERLLEPLQLDHGGEQGERLAALEPQVPEAAGLDGLEVDPRLLGAGLASGRFGERPTLRLHPRKGGAQHVGDLFVALEGGDVPGERDEVAPQAVVGEQGGGRLGVTGGQRGVEGVEPALNGLAARLGHRLS